MSAKPVLPSLDGDLAPRKRLDLKAIKACLSVRFQGFTPTPQYRPSASSRLWPTRAAALRLPDPCGLGSDSHGGNVFSGKLLEFLTQTGSESRFTCSRTGPKSTQPGGHLLFRWGQQHGPESSASPAWRSSMVVLNKGGEGGETQAVVDSRMRLTPQCPDAAPSLPT